MGYCALRSFRASINADRIATAVLLILIVITAFAITDGLGVRDQTSAHTKERSQLDGSTGKSWRGTRAWSFSGGIRYRLFCRRGGEPSFRRAVS
jgi:hypothetical protein